MDLNVINTVEPFIDKLDAIDPVDLINTDDKASQLSKLSENEFVNLYNEIIELFRLSIEKKTIYAVSQYYVNRTTNNMIDVIQILTKLCNTHLNPSRQLNLSAVENHLLECQNFLLQKGIYTLKNQITPEFDVLEFNNYKTQSRRVSRLLTDKEERLNNIYTKVEETVESLTNLLATKEIELGKISDSLESILANKEESDNVKLQINSKKSLVDDLSSSIETIRNSLKEESQRLILSLNEKISELNELIEQNNQNKENIDNWISNLDKIRTDTENANVKLQELLNPAIAKNLLMTFKSRKTQLFYAKVVWAIASGGTAWLLFYFTSIIFVIPEGEKLDLSQTLAAAIRILPFLVLLYFCLRQFTKNRTLEEEYAFRESIATSLMSYAEQITNNPDSKDELIRETVGRLYTSPLATLKRPLIKKESQSEPDKVLDKITELVKEIKSSLTPNDN